MREQGTSGGGFYRRAWFWVALCLPALLLLYAGLLYVMLPESEGEEVALGPFFEAARAGEIDAAVYLNYDNRVIFVRDGTTAWTPLPDSAQYLDTFVATALESGTPLDVDQQIFKTIASPATQVIPALLIVTAFLLVFLTLRSRGSTFTKVGLRGKGKGHGDTKPVTFADVAGVDEAVAEIAEIRDYLKEPERYAAVGAEPPRGVLLVGPPGTGKTLLARAVAGEAGVAFIAMSGTDFVEMYVGVGASRIRDLFRQVREQAPALLFIDELDAIGRTRASSSTTGQEERDQTLNQLLVELDGFYRDSGVVLIGATNRPDVLDAALLRAGRFDRQIVVDRPDRPSRLAILQVHARGKPLEASVDLDQLAAQTAGFTGADLAALLNEAALLATRGQRTVITETELDQALERVLTGSEGRVHVLTAAEKQTVAYHEAGHAVVAWACPATPPVRKVSIIGRGRRLGFTRRIAEEEKFVVDRDELEQELTVKLAGQAAEELVLAKPASTSKQDLREATTMARRMVCELGMSEALGRRALGRPTGGPFLDDDRFEPDYSAEVAAQIDREIRRLLDEAFARASQVLTHHRDVLDSLATRLIRDETLGEAALAPFAEAVNKSLSEDLAPLLVTPRSDRA